MSFSMYSVNSLVFVKSDIAYGTLSAVRIYIQLRYETRKGYNKFIKYTHSQLLMDTTAAHSAKTIYYHQSPTKSWQALLIEIKIRWKIYYAVFEVVEK